jgi:hypothetical protein
MGGEVIELAKNTGWRKEVELNSIDKQGACEALSKCLHDYIGMIINIQERFALDNAQIMSPKLIVNLKLSAEEQTHLENLQRCLDRIIKDFATRAIQRETHNNTDYPLNPQDKKYELNAYDRIRVNTLINSVRDINRSILRLKFTLEYFAWCNKTIMAEFEQCHEAGDLSGMRKLVLQNMLLIHEAANYAINFINNFKLEGIETIIQLSKAEIDKIEKAAAALEILKEKADKDEIESAVKEHILDNVAARKDSLQDFKQEWDKYIAGIIDVQAKVGSIIKKVPTLELIRDNAAQQLQFYEIIKIFGIMKIAEKEDQTLPPLDGITLALDEVRLISLPPGKVYRMIGI